MYNSYLKSGRGSLFECLHGKNLHLVRSWKSPGILLLHGSMNPVLAIFIVEEGVDT